MTGPSRRDSPQTWNSEKKVLPKPFVFLYITTKIKIIKDFPIMKKFIIKVDKCKKEN